MKLNHLSILIIVFIIFLIEVANLVFIPDWCCDFKSVIISYAALILTGSGFIVFFYDYFNTKEDFLDTEISIDSNDNYHFIKTKVLNKSGVKKNISFALLFISKQGTPPVAAMNNTLEVLELPIRFKHTNDFEYLSCQIETPQFTNNAGIVPLSFYNSENVRIGNENPAFTYTLANTSLENGIYTVRFFIFCKGKLHRSTADSLVIGNGDNRRRPNKQNGDPQTGNRIEKSKSNH